MNIRQWLNAHVGKPGDRRMVWIMIQNRVDDAPSIETNQKSIYVGDRWLRQRFPATFVKAKLEGYSGLIDRIEIVKEEQ